MNNDNRSLLQMSPAMRFVIFLVLTGISLILGVMVSFSIIAFVLDIPYSALPNTILDPQNAKIALMANAMASVMSFLLPSWAVAYFSNGSIAKNMGFNKIGSIQRVWVVILLAFAGLALSGALASLTELIPIPTNWELWAKALEETYKKAMSAITKMKSLNDLFLNLLLVAFIPALMEELYFRGALQKTIKDWFGNVPTAIILTAIIFSAFHFSFFGFLSRMALGLILGYIYEYTKTIWLPILLHFINNGVAIVSLYLVKNDLEKTNKMMDEGLPVFWGLIALVLVILLLARLKKISSYEQLDKDLQ
jgi:membrane protease YdiL (CAAX protease family)